MVSLNTIDIDINKIKQASKEYDVEHLFNSIFDSLELEYQEQECILKGRPDCLIGDIIIDFKFNISRKQLNDWVNSKGRQYIQEYHKTRGKLPSLLIVISEKNIFYYDTNVILRDTRDINYKSILSLLECLIEPKVVNAEQFAILFGIHSPLYIISYARMEKHFDDHSGEKTPCFTEWKKHFRLAYHDDEVGKELFLRHSYLSMLLKLILYKEFIKPTEYSRDSYKDLENYFEIYGISLFHYDFFRWVINVLGLCDEYFTKIKTMTFEASDIFRTIYQEMIIAGVRHRLGEYYTPESLCEKMVEKSFEVGERVLDSSCGSGTFLIECYKKINTQYKFKSTEEPPPEWFQAINNIFGFDINPIAVLTTKANLILFLKERKDFLEKIDINIYLCNSIDPVEFSIDQDIDLGSVYKFCVDLIDQEKKLNIPAEVMQKKHILAFQLVIKAFYKVWENFEDYKDTWEAVLQAIPVDIKKSLLEAKVKTRTITIGSILKEFFRELYILKLNDKDHIWLYLLNNIVGIRMILLQQKMDLIITNPPWLTYKDADKRLKENMKKISNEFEINPGAKNITNIEEAVVFLFKIPQLFLKNGGKIAFVMPRSILVSSQNEKARRFDYFENIEIFEFDDLVFNIDCCCIFGNYLSDGVSNVETAIKKYPIRSIYLDHTTIEQINEYELTPFAFFQEKPKERLIVKKLITPEKKQKLLPVYLSDYINDFIQGADLIPKSLLLCEIKSKIQNDQLAIIEPWISPQAKGVWKKRHYKQVRVESENLFKTTLSRNLYPFYIQLYDTFLPLDSNFEYNTNNLGPFSRKHWKNISEIYKRENKNDLFEVGINYRNKLCTGKKVRDAQIAPIKVVFPNAKNLMSAVIKDPNSRSFVDSTMYYYSTENEDEAYYLCGMLNIRKLFKTVKTIADTRHHHKRPLYFNIPKYSGTAEEKKIAAFSKECEKAVEEYTLSTDKIKNEEIYNLIEKSLLEIEKIGENILKSASEQKIIKEFEFD
ncbi:MAG: N-6 DNA methylase [Candidatus Thorarchaeota archaeon]